MEDGEFPGHRLKANYTRDTVVVPQVPEYILFHSRKYATSVRELQTPNGVEYWFGYFVYNERKDRIEFHRVLQLNGTNASDWGAVDISFDD
jgi:hypothetical protein